MTEKLTEDDDAYSPQEGLERGSEDRPDDLTEHQELLLDVGGGLWKIEETDDIYYIYDYYPYGSYEQIASGETKHDALINALHSDWGVVVTDKTEEP